LIFFMNWVNLVGIFLNVIIVPIIPIVTIYGFISLVLSLIIKRSIRIRPEKLLMDIIYELSQFWAKYAIFIQSGDIWKKYVLVVLFIWLWIFAYWRIYHKKYKAETTPQPTQASAAPLTGSKISSLWDWKSRKSPLWGGDLEGVDGDREAVERVNKKNQIFDEILDETEM
jgi:hypothetical protein